MKVFFNQHGYTCLKLLVTQIAISVFGTVLAMATTASGSDLFSIIVSIFAILFYIFLIYNSMWEVGAKDRLSFDLGKKEKKLATGLWIGLVESIPNFIIAIIFTIGYPFMAVQEWAGNMSAIAKVLSLYIEGMYSGLITAVTIGGAQLSSFWWTYFAITVPGIAAIWISYLIGFSNFRFCPSFSAHKPGDKR